MSRRRVARAALVVAIVTIAVPAGSRAAGTLRVDAGWSVYADAGVPFSLQAQVEGASGPLDVAWAEPAGCAVDDPDAITTTVACHSAGIKTFAFEASDGVGTASDTVAVAARSETVETIAHATGEITTLALPDEYTESGALDGATDAIALTIPPATASLEVTLDWESPANDLDLEVRDDGGASLPVSPLRMVSKPETVVLPAPAPADWVAYVRPKRSGPERWTLDALATVRRGFDLELPSVVVPRTVAEPGEQVVLFPEIAGGLEPYDVAWELDPGSVAFDDGAGEAFSFPFAGSTTVKVRVRDARGFEAIAYAFVREPGPAVEGARPMTVVAVVDNEFSPYHYDFLGHQHPWNTDRDPTNDFDFDADPASYLPGYPDAAAIRLTLPIEANQPVETLATTIDGAEWAKLQVSDLDAGVHMAWMPGTKVIGAVAFDGGFVGTNDSHGTRSAASVAGNLHGTCPECLLVLVKGSSSDGLRWAAAQPWIDVVTNSYGTSTTGGIVRDNIYFSRAVASSTRAAAEAGQTVLFSAGNGVFNANDVPQLTYASAEKGPDWIVTVGAVTPGTNQSYTWHGKPVDVSSVGGGYPSTGGGTATGTGQHSGTSNAAPVVAGYYASVIARARALVGDVSVGHAHGVVASGAPVACGSCALGDGVLTRAELDALVLWGAQPSDPAIDLDRTIPTGEHAYAYQGHGVLAGRLGDWRAQVRRMVDVARGRAEAFERPAGERVWFEVDSACRMRLWGAWDGGIYTGAAPHPDLATDPPAFALLAACERVPQDAFLGLGD